jgi:small subunit ribosomal protein S1
MPTSKTTTPSASPTQDPASAAINAKKLNKGFTKIFRDDDDEQDSYKEEGLTFAQLFENSVVSNPVAEGEVVLGRVVSVGQDKVLVDVGYKSEGEIDISEFKGPQGDYDVQIGDEVFVLLERVENENGLLSLSKEKADVLRAWDEIAEACERNEILEGVVQGVVKGGLSVDIGVKAFLPGSQVDVRPVKNLDQFVGKTFKFKVIKFNKKRGNIVLSRRAVLELERDHLKSSTLKQLKVGAIVRGTVKNITDYGAFVDLGGVDGLLHITDMSWGRIKHPSEVLQVGADINVRVLRYDSDKERVSLGLKQTQPDPWSEVGTKYLVGQRIHGKVVSITDYGAFVEVEPGIEGLIHVSEMSWTQRVKDPRKLLNVDQDIEAVILDIDNDARRMSLGLKQITANPWDTLEHKYPNGTRVKGVIKNITDFGIFVEIEEGIDGLVHVSDLSWDQKVSHPSQMFEKGQEVEAVVLSIDKENERISLSIKALQGDPWADSVAAYKPGTQVEGTVTKLANFGAFVELEKGVEGMVHVSELSEERVMHPEQVVKVGDKIRVEILSIDMKERKISLSVKAIKRREERENIEAYREKQGSSRSSFADMLNPELAAKLSKIGKDEKGE